MALGLHERGEPVGICTVIAGERLVDGPGVVPALRDPARYARLLLAACAELGPGSADIDTWGDGDDVLAAYAALGFEVVERVRGWELRV